MMQRRPAGEKSQNIQDSYADLCGEHSHNMSLECASVGSTWCSSNTLLVTVCVQSLCIQFPPLSPQTIQCNSSVFSLNNWCAIVPSLAVTLCTQEDVHRWQTNSGIIAHRQKWKLMDSCVGDTPFLRRGEQDCPLVLLPQSVDCSTGCCWRLMIHKQTLYCRNLRCADNLGVNIFVEQSGKSETREI